MSPRASSLSISVVGLALAGACLADDMGLGKTIQLIALLQLERQKAAEGTSVGPTLLVVPMSVLGNWKRELARFAPELKVLLFRDSNS